MQTILSEPAYGTEIPLYRLSESAVGICGVGRIGSAFARRVYALGSRVIAYDTQYNKQGRAFPDFVEFVSFDELLKTSDVISIHCPLDKDAYHLFDKEAISLMKQSAYLINVVRGGIIDEDALLWALENKKIAGAGIDVVEHEPLNADSPLLQHDNFLVSPHTAWYSQQSVQELKRKAAEEAVRFLTGKPVRYPVNEIHRKEALSI